MFFTLNLSSKGFVIFANQSKSEQKLQMRRRTSQIHIKERSVDLIQLKIEKLNIKSTTSMIIVPRKEIN